MGVAGQWYPQIWGLDPMDEDRGNADAEQDLIDVHREEKVTQIQDIIRRGNYRVDPEAVADAIVRRLGLIAALKASPAVTAPAGRAATPGLTPVGRAPIERPGLPLAASAQKVCS